MPITPEEAQKITDLRARMLDNVQKGLDSTNGISQEELSQALAFVRSNRSAASVAKAASATGGRKKKSADAALATKPSGVANNPKFAKFLNKSLD